MGKFCFKCGCATENKGMCDACANDNATSVKLTDKSMEIIQCSQCRDIKVANGWKEFEPSEFFKRKLKATRIEVEEEKSEGANTWFKIKTEKGGFKIKVHFNRLVCGTCGRRISGFYSAIIQLRGSVTQKIFEDVLSTLDSGTDKMGFYDVAKVRGGYDFRIGSKSAAKNVVNYLRKRYHVRIVRSYKLVTRKDGRDVKRDVVCVRV